MAVDIFLKLTGIKGETQDAKHKDEIHVESFSWGMNQTGSSHLGGGAGTGKVSVHDVSVKKFVDKASAPLMLYCASGKHIPEGLITVRKAGDKPLEYLKIKLTDILVAAIHQAGQGEELINENVTLNFSKFNVEYQQQNADGSGQPAGEMGWDIKANQKV